MVPTDLRYTKDHEWVRVDGDEATVGITEYAAGQLGDIVFVELPDAGRTLEQFATFGVVESVKAVSDLFAPVSGEVVTSNEALAGSPGARQCRPLRRRLDDPDQARQAGGSRRASRRGGVRRVDRGGLARCPTDRTPTKTGSGCSRHSASNSVDELFADIPAPLRASRLDLPEPEPELELAARLEGLAGKNRTDLASFLGAGVYRHWTPAAVDQLLLRGEWYTAYTPYQPEISQGTLQSIYEYESLIAELMDLDVVSASHYDGAAATAEAALMTCRATRRERVLVSRAVHPHYRQTVQAYFGGGLEVEEIPRRGGRTGVRDDRPRGTRAAPGGPGAPGCRRRGRSAELLRTAGADGGDRTVGAWRRRAVRGCGRTRLARGPCATRAHTGPISPPAKASRSGSRPSTADPISASLPRPMPSSGRSLDGSSG